MQKTFQSRTELMSLFVLGVRVPMNVALAATASRRKLRCPSAQGLLLICQNERPPPPLASLLVAPLVSDL